MSETKKNIPVVSIIIATVSLIIGFTIGLFYQKSKTPSFSRNNQTKMGGPSGQVQGITTGPKNNGQMSGFKQTIGEITSVDDKSVTIKTTDGGSKIILVSDSTAINQSTAATKTDLKVGTKIAVFGDQNTDGSITSKTINLNPAAPEAMTTPTAKK